MTKSLVEQVLRKNNLWKEYCRQRPVILWSEVVGPRMAHLTRAQRVHKGRLVVEVASSTVAHELSVLSEEYKQRMNQRLGRGGISSIRFVPGQFDIRKPVSSPAPLTAEDRREAKALFTAVEDASLKKTFVNLFLTLRQRERQLLARGGHRCPACGAVYLRESRVCPGCSYSGVEDQHAGN